MTLGWSIHELCGGSNVWVYNEKTMSLHSMKLLVSDFFPGNQIPPLLFFIDLNVSY